MLNLQMNNFVPPGVLPAPPTANIIADGNIQSVITTIDHAAVSTTQKIKSIFDCLSQTYSLSGPYQGKCQSELINRLFQYTVNHAQHAEAALNESSIKFDPHLQDVINKVNALIKIYHPENGSLMNVRMDCFFPIAGHGDQVVVPAPINLLQTGGINTLIDYIQTNFPNVQDKLRALLNCLDQTLASSQPSRGECEAGLKNRIWHLSRNDPQQVSFLTDAVEFKHNSKLKPTLEKMTYLAKSSKGKKFYHFQQVFTNNKRYGVTYLTASLSLIFVGGLQAAIGTPGNSSEEDRKRKLGWTTMIVGLAMLFVPLYESYALSKGEDP